MNFLEKSDNFGACLLGFICFMANYFDPMAHALKMTAIP